MIANPSVITIRDGLEKDIAECIALEHVYETDYVWQMVFHADDDFRCEMTLKRERLPRTMSVELKPNEKRLQAVLPPQECYIVAAHRETEAILGYLAMRAVSAHGFGLITDLLVARRHRRRGIGARLITAACHWAKERELSRVMAETQTKNFPAVEFFTKLGFAFCGFNDKYFRNQDIAVFFSLSLR